MKETAVRYKAEVSKAEAKAKEAEHRAEVAERELERYTVLIKPLEVENARLNHLAARAKRALKKLASFFAHNAKFLKDEREKERYQKTIFDDWINQAEEELAEEGKDG